jgi:hypothetical protein
MIFTRTIGGHQLVAECAAMLEPAVSDIFKTFDSLARSGKMLHAGFSVRFGWSLLTLSEESGGLRICEPRYSGDPVHELNPTLDTTIEVLVSQIKLLRSVGARGEDVFFDQQILLAPGTLTAPEIFALRGEGTSESDSGWSVAPVPAPGEQIDTRHLTAVPVFRLVESHRGLLSVLTLPLGHLARLRGGNVAEVDDPDGHTRWGG